MTATDFSWLDLPDAHDNVLTPEECRELTARELLDLAAKVLAEGHWAPVRRLCYYAVKADPSPEVYSERGELNGRAVARRNELVEAHRAALAD